MQISKSLFALNIVLLSCTPCFGQNLQEFNREINVNQFFNELQGQVGYEGTDIENKNKPLQALESLGTEKRENNNKKNKRSKNMDFENYECTKGTCDVDHTFSTQSTFDRAEEMEVLGFSRNKEGMPEHNKGFLDKALSLVKNSDKEFDFLKSANEVCTPGEETITDSTVETCDQFYSLEEQSCFPKQVVEIDPKYNYQCSKKREVKEKICNDEITSIKCENSAECDLGGIEPGSVASDMMFHNENGVLTIGTIADNYWSGHCNLYDKTTTFKLKNVDLIKDFTVFNVGFDDYMEILVNGRSVYAGPDGGQNLQIVQRTVQSFFFHHTELKVNNGHSDQICERNHNWNFPVNIDLKHYLVEGENNIRIRVIVSGHGEGWLKIRAKQNCCSKWQIEREEKCEYQ